MASSSSSSASRLSSAYYSVKSGLSSAEVKLEKGLTILSNKYVNTLLLVLLVAYLPYAAPKLGPSMIGILNNYAVKFIYIFILAFILSKSVKVSTLAALVLVIGILIIKKMGSTEYLDNVSNQEQEAKPK